MKDNIFRFSTSRLKETQRKLKDKKVFKLDKDNYKDYETFILKSLSKTSGRNSNRIDI